MESLTERVAARFRQRVADKIGDPVRLVSDFEGALERFSSLEKNIPEMRRVQQVLDEGPSNPEYVAAGRLHTHLRYEFLFRVTHGYAAFHRVGHSLFLALLQQYDLPPKLRKTVELSAKFYSKTRVQKPARGKEVETYEKYLGFYRAQFETAKAALAQGKPHAHETSPAAKITAGPFTIVNTGGFSPEIIAEVSEVVETSARLLQAKGLGRVCYGDVLVSNTLSRANVLAFYLVEKDEFFVRANLKGKKHDAVRTVTHELGHRLHFKFLKAKSRDIQSIYYKLSMKERERQRALIKDPALRPQPGEKLNSKGKTYTVESVIYDTVRLVQDDDPSHGAKISLVGYLELKGVDTSSHGTTFVTGYAAKNDEENFAEMIAYYCLNKLPADQVQMLEAVIS